jgi:transposase-like protein
MREGFLPVGLLLKSPVLRLVGFLAYANQLRRRRPRPGDAWHLDEVFLTINGTRHYLWRAVDQEGHVLDILVQGCRNKQAWESQPQ